MGGIETAAVIATKAIVPPLVRLGIPFAAGALSGVGYVRYKRMQQMEQAAAQKKPAPKEA